MSDDLMKQWRDCSSRNKVLEGEIATLKKTLAAINRRHEIALNNAYEEGYNAGRMDTLKLANKRNAR
jgi:hypothetical protein